MRMLVRMRLRIVMTSIHMLMLVLRDVRLALQVQLQVQVKLALALALHHQLRQLIFHRMGRHMRCRSHRNRKHLRLMLLELVPAQVFLLLAVACSISCQLVGLCLPRPRSWR